MLIVEFNGVHCSVPDDVIWYAGAATAGAAYVAIARAVCRYSAPHLEPQQVTIDDCGNRWHRNTDIDVHGLSVVAGALWPLFGALLLVYAAILAIWTAFDSRPPQKKD